MGLSDIVNLNITLKSTAPTQAGFGRALITTYRTAAFTGRTKLYKNADDLLLDGFVTSDIEYKKAVALKSQRPSPKDFKLGKCLLPPTQIIDLTPSNVTANFTYSGTVKGTTTLNWTYTSDGTPTLAEICTGIAAAIDAHPDVVASGVSGTKVTVTTSVAGKIVQLTDMTPELQVKDATVDPGIATDLANIFLADSDWFGLVLSSTSEAEVNAAAAWIETQRRMMHYVTADFGAKDAGTTTDIFSDLKALDYFNTIGWYHHEVGSVLDAAVMGLELTKTPGSYTMAHKSLAGVSVTGAGANGTLYLTAAQEAAIAGKNGNYYTAIAGNGNTWESKTAGGEFADVTRYIHFQFARVQESVIALFQGNDKIPYTDAGADKVRGSIETVLIAHTKPPYDALVPGSVLVTVPKVADVSASDKTARKLPDVTYSATLQGAIHATTINGTVSTV